MREKSRKIWNEMQQRIPGGVNSPVRACRAVDTHPLLVESGKGSYIWDVDGNKYLDVCMSWGALIHGHAEKEILAQAHRAIDLGSTFGITTKAEGELAELISSCMDSLEMMRFVSSGTEATMSAVRLARAFTGREDILKFQGHYHGHADQFLVHAGSGVAALPQASSAGVPAAYVAHTKTIPFNDVALLSEFLFDQRGGERIACVIVEPVAANMGVVPMQRELLQLLEEGRQRYGYLLIFDEVITGFRVGRGGAQEMYGCRPDLTCLGKIIGGGFPAAAFGGRRDVMSLLAPLGPVYQAGTLSGNPVAMAAGNAALSLIKKSKNFYEELRRKADVFLKPVREYIAQEHLLIALPSVGAMWTIFFGVKEVVTSRDLQLLQHQIFTEYFHHMLSSGVYIPPCQNEAWALASCHTDEELRYVADVTLEFLSNNKERLR